MFNSLITKISLALSTSIFYATVKNCGLGTSVFTLNEVTITPDTPLPGDNVSLYIDYTVPGTVFITGGTAEYDVKYNFIPFSPTIEPLCHNIPCPLGPGTYSNTSVSVWPSDLSGSLVTQMKWWTPDKLLLLCVEIAGKFWASTDLVLVPSSTKVVTTL